VVGDLSKLEEGGRAVALAAPDPVTSGERGKEKARSYEGLYGN